MAEPFKVEPKDYLPGGRLYNNNNYYVAGGGDIIEDKKTGVAYAPGSVAIPFTGVTNYESLPAEVKSILGGTAEYNPFQGATGYAYDPATGSVTIQKGASTMTLGSRYTRTPSGRFEYSEELTFPDAADVGDSSGKGDDLAAIAADRAAAEERRREGQSAYSLLFEEFSRYGLGSLVEPLRNLIVEGLSPAEFTLRLRDTDAYKKRFAANQSRIQKGLRALSEAEYIGLEDQYQDVMRRYGLPESYTKRGDMGRQEGFERFIAGDVSPVELEDRIQTAQNRVINAPAQVRDALSQFYGAEITNGDVLAYMLDPDRALPQIQRKVTAAEIGAGAAMAGLGATRARAEELGTFGVTGEQARQGFATISEFLPTAQKLSDIYSKQGVGPFTQTTAEQEVFGLAGAAEAQRQRRKLTELEQAAFSGTSGAAGGALARDRAGAF